MFQILLIVVGTIGALVFIGWLGLQIQPSSFPAFAQRSPELKTIPVPKGLPTPVQRYYRIVYGENIPVITSGVITGRAMMRPVGPVTFPARLRFTHIAGQAYRHYIELTWFGLPIIKANERYIDGKGFMDIQIIGTDKGEKIDQAANLALWAESSKFPAIYLTDPRVHWEPVDDSTAILVVPFNQTHEHIVVRFDAETGLITWLESMRYQSSKSQSKVLWLNHALDPEIRDGKPVEQKGAVIWMDDGKPWFILTVEDMVFNVDVQEYIHKTGL